MKTNFTPYYAVIFTSVRTDFDHEAYAVMSEKMLNLAIKQDGFIDIESARENIGITVSYWKDLESIQKWKLHVEHTMAQNLGKDKWYSSFKVRITKVQREYSFERIQ